jgi:hypothetical protein
MGRTDGRLFDALLTRRSRRVGRGMDLPGGPLGYRSATVPAPLSEEEVAALVFAAAGITGGALFDWDLSAEAGNNMLATLVGRTVPSAEAVHTTALFVVDDEGAWLMPRPADLEPSVARGAAQMAARGDYLGAWRLTRIRISDRRPRPSLEWPNNIEANRWSLYAPGTTTFLPVVENTFLLINVLLTLLSEQTGLGLLDDRRMFLPAGLSRFMKKNGGHLEDDPTTLKSMPLAVGERITEQMGCVEMGAMLQNLHLAAEAMGLGGFIHYAHSDFGYAERTWFDELGFTSVDVAMSRLFGVPPPASWVLKLRGHDVPLRVPVGLEVDGRTVLRSYRPPHVGSMTEAVRAVVEHKLGEMGTYRAGVEAGRWLRPEAVAASVPPVSEAGLEATIAFCEYVWNRYGRFPVSISAFHTLVAFQVSHVDAGFYEDHYQADVLTPAHLHHESIWHTAVPIAERATSQPATT